ncbi:MAG: baseplate J/gp47 family protein [Proteobacteria bacterium]|nr:baseplate J/gp47 family protein [Pseudomonadota bacterium]
MGNFTPIDLSKLPAPKVIESLNYEEIFQDILSDFLEKNPSYSTLLESDPAMILLEVCAYRELLLRNRINEAAKATMLAYATGSDLENLAASLGVQKLVGENDDQLRQRVQLAPEAFTNAGSIGAYTFHALSASSDIKSVSVKSPNPGEVLVTILSKIGNGAASEELLAAVLEKLSDEDVRPLTDSVSVQSAEIVSYSVEAVITVYSGPSSAVVETEARADLNKFLDDRHAIGKIVALSGIYDALHVDGVKKVQLIHPTSDVITTDEQAAYTNSKTISIVVDE